MRLLKNLCLFTILILSVHSCKDACDDIDCGVNGTCVDGTCVCESGWSGVNCETSFCQSIDCGPNGSCNPATQACDCNEGYSGINCEVNVCDAVDCGPNGTCNTTTGECSCDEGYEGPNCEIEIREKYVGIYQGDMTPCIPPIVALLIPADQLETLVTTQLEVSASAMGINFLTISSTSDVLNLGLDTDINDPNFEIPEFSQEVDVNNTAVTITGVGTGMYLSSDTLQLDLQITYDLDLATLNANCNPKFGKQ